MGSDSHTALNDAPTSRDSAASSGNAKARHDSELPKSKRRATVARDVWKFHMRPDDDDEPEDWWFAGTAIPLIAATTGPLANVLSIAALVTSWRATLPNNGTGADDAGIPFPDPHWCYDINAASLACGFLGNIFLLFNFTRRVRYIVALPMTITLWTLATIMLIAITLAMELHVPPARPQQTYSQGYWHAVIAAILYALSAMGLMVNMLGYVLGHYPRQFELTDDQRNLILQTMMFFFWLAGGAAVFARVCGWSYVDSLYFCDVTVLTVGFGDFYAPNDAGRGLVFPFSVGGIIILGLMISSLSRFSSELGQDHIVKKHVEKKRSRTIDRSAPDSFQIVHKQGETFRAHQPTISGPIVLQNRTIAFHDDQKPFDGQNGQTCDHGDTQRPPSPRTNSNRTSRRSNSRLGRIRSGKPRFLLLHEEKDRFQAMREIQRSTQKFKRWYALGMSVTAFGILWCVGAVVFWQVEQRIQQLSYFEALYFCYVSLLTIGYGDLAPKSNAGKPFFVVWSLVAVPTMTILIGDLGDTVIASFKQGTFALADWTVLPKAGLWRGLLERNPWLLLWIQEKIEARAAKKRIDEGFRPPTDEEDDVTPTIDQLANVEDERETEHYLPQKLALAIKKTANDLKEDPPRRYSYEEWVVFTRLIRFSALKEGEVQEEEDEEGLVEWDWIGEDSPMMSVGSGGESSWVLDRLCESLNRYMRSQRRQAVKATNATPVVKVDGDSPDFSIEAS